MFSDFSIAMRELLQLRNCNEAESLLWQCRDRGATQPALQTIIAEGRLREVLR
jgi:hypothetical protein